MLWLQYRVHSRGNINCPQVHPEYKALIYSKLECKAWWLSFNTTRCGISPVHMPQCLVCCVKTQTQWRFPPASLHRLVMSCCCLVSQPSALHYTGTQGIVQPPQLHWLQQRQLCGDLSTRLVALPADKKTRYKLCIWCSMGLHCMPTGQLAMHVMPHEFTLHWMPTVQLAMHFMPHGFALYACCFSLLWISVQWVCIGCLIFGFALAS